MSSLWQIHYVFSWGKPCIPQRFLKCVNTNQITCFTAFSIALNQQIGENQHRIGIEETKTIQHAPTEFDLLPGLISHFALCKAISHLQLLQKKLLEPCTKAFGSSWGIPCAHDFALAADNEFCITTSLFHPQWHLTLAHVPHNQTSLHSAIRRQAEKLYSLPYHTSHKVFDDISLILTCQ